MTALGVREAAAAPPTDKFFELETRSGKAVYDVTTVRMLTPSRFIIAHIDFDEPRISKYRLQIVGQIRGYCGKPVGEYPPSAEMMQFGRADLPAKNIVVQETDGLKIVAWEYPYSELRDSFFLESVRCTNAAKLEAYAAIQNGVTLTTLFDCERAQIGEIFKGDGPEKALTQFVHKGTYGYSTYTKVCKHVLNRYAEPSD